MGTQHIAAHEAPTTNRDGGRGGGGKTNSPRQNRGGSIGVCCRRIRRCSANVCAVLALAILAGCTTVGLQLMASRHSWVKRAANNKSTPQQEHQHQEEKIPGRPALSPSKPYQQQQTTSTATAGRARWESQQDEADTLHGQPPDELGSPVVPKHGRLRLTVDRRFVGQRTGRPPNGEDEVEYRPPPSVGPYGWGTDWAVGVSTRQGGEDVIEPPWCLHAENRSFVERVMERRATTVDSSNRVASCVRVKDWGRYLPEWVAYHWALGVDEFVVLDDESVDDTREVLEPFIRAGIVKFRSRHIVSPRDKVEPLTECLGQYRDMQDYGVDSAPRWVLLIDADEYMWAGDLENNLADVLETYSSTCCLQVSRVHHGSSGLSEPPRGLIIENFLMHANPAAEIRNGLPKVVVNLRPGEPASGKFDSLTSTHTILDCQCEVAPVQELTVRHYVTTRQDLRAKTRRYWGGQYTDKKVDSAFRKRDRNEYRSDDILVWGCVVRHLLARAAGGRHVVTNRSLPSLSPHHPAAHGLRPLDPYGEQELERTAACMNAVRSCPTVAGTVWGNKNMSPFWLQHFCGARYVFVHSFEGTGGMDVVRLLGAHAWVETHKGKSAMREGGSALTSAVPSASEMQEVSGESLLEQCGCAEAESPGCWRYCPALQHSLLEKWRVNKVRRQLVQDWFLRFNFKTEPGKPLVLVERDPDMFLMSKQGLFPFVSTSVLSVRHPLCTPAVAGTNLDNDIVAGLSEWRHVWTQVFADQLPDAKGDVWVARYEDIMAQEEDVASALWAAIGLPPISPYPPPTTAPRGGEDSTVQPPSRRATATATAAAAAASSEPRLLAQTLGDGLAAESALKLEERASNPGGAPRSGKGKGKGGRRLKGRPGRVTRGMANEGAVVDGRLGVGEAVDEEGEEVGVEEVRPVRRRLMAGDALSRASGAVQSKVLPPECRARIAACDADSACVSELERASALMQFFGYGGEHDVLNSHRFLWGKEELMWLGKRLKDSPTDPLPRRQSDGDSDSRDAPSFILP